MENLPTDIQAAITELDRAWKDYNHGLAEAAMNRQDYLRSLQWMIIEKKTALIHTLTSNIV